MRDQPIDFLEARLVSPDGKLQGVAGQPEILITSDSVHVFEKEKETGETQVRTMPLSGDYHIMILPPGMNDAHFLANYIDNNLRRIERQTRAFLNKDDL